MASKALFLLLGAVLVLQGYDARYHDMQAAEIAIGERLKLLKIVRTEFNDMTYQIIGKCVIVLEKILKDPKLLAVETDEMKSKLEEIRRVVEDYKELKKNAGIEEMASPTFRNKFFGLLAKIDTEKVPISPEGEKIAISLKENGLLEVKEHVKERQKILMEKVYAEVEKYYEGLKEAQKKDESELLDFMKAYKADSDFIARGRIISNLLENLEVENFLW